MSEATVAFESWAIVEIMGHRQFAGFVGEQTIGGVAFVRIDVPECKVNGQTLPAFTKLFGASAIYAISPCTEETAMAFAQMSKTRSFNLYEAPRLPAPDVVCGHGSQSDDLETFEEDDLD